MSNNLPKGDLAAFVATEAGVTKAQAAAVITALGPVIATNAANGYTITLPGLGRFSEKVRAARSGRNPATGAAIEIPEGRKLTFKASSKKEA